MRVLIVEDDPKIAAHLADGLRQEGHEACVAPDGAAGLALATEAAPPFQAVVLDIMLPRMDGFEVLKAMRLQGVNAPVLMLSALDAVDDRVRGLRAGADDYLVKPFAFDELIARLLVLFRRAGTPAPEPTLLAAADLTVDRLERRVRRGGVDIELQPKEFALLEYFLRNAGRPLTKPMILEHVWHWNFDPRTNVVDVLVFRLRNKIDRDFAPKLIHTIRGVGYALRAP